MLRASKLPRDKIVEIVSEHLIGMEAEPVTAALCVANMILRGDGSTGVRRADCFDDTRFPFGAATAVLMNPPFPHKKTDTPPQAFIDRALQGLKKRGLAAVVVPSSLLVKRPIAAWRKDVLRSNSLRAVISLPSELFQPYAAATTAILVFEKGVPHAAQRPVFFASVSNDGLRLKKGVRVTQPSSQLPDLLREFPRMGSVPEFCGPGYLTEEGGWAPGAYIPTRALTADEIATGVGELVRSRLAFVALHAPVLARMLTRVKSGALKPRPYARHGRASVQSTAGTLGGHFDIYYGQKALHSKEALEPGDSLVISSSGMDNGCYGFFDFNDVLAAPFVTVPSTGSIGEASVQEYPCGVTDDCLLLIPRPGTPHEALYLAAATLRCERWRFDYGRKMTPDRIAAFPLRTDADLLASVRRELDNARAIEQEILTRFAPFETGETVDRTDGPQRAEMPQLRVVQPRPEERYVTAVPLLPLKVAAGAFGEPQHVVTADADWVEVQSRHRLREGMFVAQVVGRSMEPEIPDGSYCLFAAPVTGTRQGKTVLVQLRDEIDPETGERFTVKRYHSEKSATDESWRHVSITLVAVNPDFAPIVLTEVEEGAVGVVAEFVEVLGLPARERAPDM